MINETMDGKSDPKASREPKKRPYSEPHLTHYGRLNELTRISNGATGTNDNYKGWNKTS